MLNAKKEQTYQITVTAKQAMLLSLACETIARLGAGQLRRALEHLPLNRETSGWNADMDTIGQILSRHTKNNIGGWHSSLSIHSDVTSESSKIAWDLYQVIRRRLAWDRAVEDGIVETIYSPRKWPEMLRVFYDDPLKTSKEPLAKIQSGS